MRRDGERTDLENLAAFKMFPGFRCECVGYEVGGCAHNAFSRLAHHNWDVGANLRDQPPVVAMPVGQDDCEQRRIGFSEAGNLRDEGRVRFNGIEGQAEIDDDAASRRRDFDAGAADLLGAAMDADLHLCIYFRASFGFTDTGPPCRDATAADGN